MFFLRFLLLFAILFPGNPQLQMLLRKEAAGS